MNTDTLESMVIASIGAEPEFFLDEAARLIEEEQIDSVEPDALIPFVATIIKMGFNQGIHIAFQSLRDNGITLHQRGQGE